MRTSGEKAQHRSIRCGRIRDRLPPVILNELRSDRLRSDGERRPGIISPLDRQIRECEEQGELVRRGELALVQDSLKIHQELDLIIGSRRHLFPPVRRLSAITHLTPPRGSGTSPRRRGMT